MQAIKSSKLIEIDGTYDVVAHRREDTDILSIYINRVRKVIESNSSSPKIILGGKFRKGDFIESTGDIELITYKVGD